MNQLPDELSTVIKMVLNKEEKGKFNCKQIDSYSCNEKTLRDAGMSEDYISELIRVYISLDDEIYVAYNFSFKRHDNFFPFIKLLSLL